MTIKTAYECETCGERYSGSYYLAFVKARRRQFRCACGGVIIEVIWEPDEVKEMRIKIYENAEPISKKEMVKYLAEFKVKGEATK